MDTLDFNVLLEIRELLREITKQNTKVIEQNVKVIAVLEAIERNQE